jgi:hypothetical protein
VAQRKKRRARAFARPQGQAGRNGAPDSAEFSALLREHLAAELDKPCPEASDGSATNLQALSEKLVQMAVKGSKDAIQIVLDRLAGKAQPAASPSEDAPVHIEYVIGVPRPDHEQQSEATPPDGV